MDNDATDMPIFLTPYLLIEGSVAEVVDCLIGPFVAWIEDRTVAYRGTLRNDINTMHASISVYAEYGVDPPTNHLVGWLHVERIRKQCHLDMHAIAQHRQIACDVLLLMPRILNYLNPVTTTHMSPWEIINNVDLTDTNPTPSKKAKRITTQMRYAKLYNEALPLIESGLSRKRVAEQLKISERRLTDVLKDGNPQREDKK